LLWSNSLAAARASAKSQGKLILLLAGHPDCGTCDYMETVVCESATVRPIIDEIYVPWYANIDFYQDFLPYEAGMSSQYDLPLLCMIDPKTTNAWLLRVDGGYSATAFASVLRQAASLCPPQPTNLVDRQVIRDGHFEVAGHLWSQTQPANVYYRVNVGTGTLNPFTAATGTTNWTAGLTPYLVAGVSNRYTLDIYARFNNGSTSRTNSLVFDYNPAAVPPTPRIGSITVNNRVATLALTNLTAGVTNRLERSLDLRLTNGWITVTNFVSPGSTHGFSEPLSDSWRNAFYRISLKP
jgi:hypothetical protein